MKFPASLLPAFLSCTATTGTCSATVSPCDVALLANRIVIAFNWTDTSAGPNCVLKDFESLTVTNDVTTVITGWNAFQELQKNPGAWFGKTVAGVAGMPVGVAVTVKLKFTTKAKAWCHTCTPSPVVVTVSTTVR